MIKERLLVLPRHIEETRLKLLNVENSLLNNQDELKTWELMQLDEIARETDEKGKAIYSNDTKRKAELERRKSESEDYKELEGIISSLKCKIEIKNIQLDRLYNEQSNLRAICRLEGSLDG